MREKQAVINSIAEFVLRNHIRLTYADINGERCAFKSVDAALGEIDPEKVETLILKGKRGVLGIIHLRKV
ncbi:MAG: hypothetical protein U9M96_04255 [Thermodesulfobacteriota bacterium]|nr:hypothetical protein [Thermodesulfobacteriota bacterium]